VILAKKTFTFKELSYTFPDMESTKDKMLEADPTLEIRQFTKA
jgi:hypothetical protein